MSLTEAVDAAIEWATADGVKPHARALAELAVSLAKEITDGGSFEKPAPVAQLAKELRATLEDLEGLRDGDTAATSLGLVLSTPVWDTAEPEPAKPRASRRAGGNKSR